jgi:hypothetical protein
MWINLSNSLRFKLKIVGIIAAVLLMSIGNNFWGKKRFQELDQSFTTLYKDRLLPASYTFELTKNLYEKRLAIEKIVHQCDEEEALETAGYFSERNERIDQLLHEFEQTYLIEAEGFALKDLREKIEACRSLEATILSHAAMPDVHAGLMIEFQESFDMALNDLSILNQIQLDMGSKIRKDSKALLAGSFLMANFEISLVVIIALLLLFVLFLIKLYHHTPAGQSRWN